MTVAPHTFSPAAYLQPAVLLMANCSEAPVCLFAEMGFIAVFVLFMNLPTHTQAHAVCVTTLLAVLTLLLTNLSCWRQKNLKVTKNKMKKNNVNEKQ